MTYPKVYIRNGPMTERSRIHAALETLEGDMNFFITHCPPIMRLPEERFVVQVELLHAAIDPVGSARILAIDELEYRLSCISDPVCRPATEFPPPQVSE
ncbi:hypothetical protein BDV59DRAFT_205321 [Aspergillus ambiguus]|uniref:uncharacterized protein n=1 Tax=Aspergillus ambiguus TaxID=176160 RepID=UPI003CCDC5FA